MRLPSLLAFALVTSVGLCSAPSFGQAKGKPVDKEHAPKSAKLEKGGGPAADKKAAHAARKGESEQQLRERVTRLEHELAALRKEIAALHVKGGGDAKAKFQEQPGGAAKFTKDGQVHPDKVAAK